MPSGMRKLLRAREPDSGNDEDTAGGVARERRWLVSLAVLALALAIPIGVAQAEGDPTEANAGFAEEIPAPPPVASDAMPEEPSEAEQAESETAHSDLADAAALDTARDAFGEALEAELFPEVELNNGAERGEYLNPYTVQIITPGDAPNGVVESTLPLRAPEDGEQVPIDGELEQSGDHYEPENPLVESEIPVDLADGITIGSAGVVVTPAAVDPSTPSEVADKLFYANTGIDSDTIVAPMPTGVMVLYHIRSSESPVGYELELEVPPGGTLQPAGDGGAEVRVGDEVALVVEPPVATDAAGQVVPVSYEVSGDRLRVVVPHRDAGFLYPILVDPAFADPKDTWGWWANGSSQDIAYWGWGATEPGYSALQPPIQPGLMNRARHGYGYAANSHSWWYTQAYADTFIERADLYEIYHDPSPPGACSFIGMLTWAGSYLYTTVEKFVGSLQQGEVLGGGAGFYVSTDPSAPCAPTGLLAQSRTIYIGDSADPSVPDAQAPDGNTVVFGLKTGGSPGYRSENAQNLLSGANVYRYDRHPPSASVPSPPGPRSVWRDPGDSETVNVVVNDAGMGVFAAGVGDQHNSPVDLDSDGDPQQAEAFQGCQGNHTARCPGSATISVSYRPREGDNIIEAVGMDASGNRSAKTTWFERIDRSPPVFDELSGPLWENRGLIVDRAIHNLTVRAADEGGAPSPQRSGVARIEFRVDGTEKAAVPVSECTSTVGSGGQTLPTGCPARVGPVTWPFDARQLGAGQHTIKVIARDQLDSSTPGCYSRHCSSSSFTIAVAPDTEILTGPTQESGPNASFSFQGVSGTGAVDHFECKLDGGAYSPCSSSKEYTGLAEGEHTFSVRAVAVVTSPTHPPLSYADPTSATRSFFVDRSAPRLYRATGWGEVQEALGQNPNPWVGAYPQVVIDAEDGGRGPLSIDLRVGGTQVDRLSTDCSDGDCRIQDSLLPNLSQRAPGPYPYELVARDGVGNQVSRSGNLTLDPTAPGLSVTGPLADSAGAPLAGEQASAVIQASDVAAGHSGVSKIEVSVDGELVVNRRPICDPSCPSLDEVTYTYRKSRWGEDPRRLTVVAKDAAGNVARETLDVNVVELSPPANCTGFSPTDEEPVRTVSTSQAEAAALPDAIAPSEPAYDPELDAEVDPTVERPDDSPPTPLDAEGTLTDEDIASVPAGGFTIGRVAEFVPTQTTSAETEAAIVNADSAIYANSAPATDTIVRPTAGGVTVVESMRRAAAPDSFAWKVCLQDGYELEELDNGAIAIVDPAQPVSPDLVVPEPPQDPLDPDEISDAAAQLAIAEYETAAAEQETGQAVAAVITLPYTVDWAGNPARSPLDLEAADKIRLSVRAAAQHPDWVVMGVVTYPTPSQARGVPTAIPAYYMNDVDTAEELRGRAQAIACKVADRQPGDERFHVMLLGFGKPVKMGPDEYGAGFSGGRPYTNNQILNALQHAADRYRTNGPCWSAGKRAFITYGTTNNMEPEMSGAAIENAGRRHANVGNRLRDYMRERPDHYWNQGTALAQDIEPTWNRPGRTFPYVNTAKQAFPGLFINFGNAAGCPPAPNGCIEGWSVPELAAVSFGLGGAPMPEVYTNLEAKQWANILDFQNGAFGPGDRNSSFYGVTGSRLHSTKDPRQSWQELDDRTNGRAGKELIDIGFSHGLP